MNFTNSPILDYVTYLPKTLTEKITELLINLGISVNQAWSSRMILLLSLILIFIGLKISKPLVKWIIVILSISLILGLFIPF